MTAGDRGSGPGERAERARRWRVVWTTAAMGIAIAPVGYLLGRADRGSSLLEGTMPPALAVALTIAFLLVMLVGSTLLWRNQDEHAKVESLWAIAYASAAFVIVYPTWFLLWKGRLLTEPQHLILFLIFYAGGLVGYAVRYVLQRR